MGDLSDEAAAEYDRLYEAYEEDGSDESLAALVAYAKASGIVEEGPEDVD